MAGPKVDRTGQVLDERYRLDKLIGRGAMADVYAATDLEAQLAVAIKVQRLTMSLAADGEALSRFEREVQVQGMIRHRNVAALYGSGVMPSREPYLVVELLRGKSLRSVIKSGVRVGPQRALVYSWQALQGLSAVHALGVLHRDLKPANLMLEPSPGPVERVVLIDFGFASLEGGASLTQQGHVVGSLTYVAPERLRGETADERSDLYAIGVILYELLTGRAPFVTEDDFDLIAMHLSDPPTPLAAVAPELAALPGVQAVVTRALAKHPAERYTTALEMAAAIEAAATALR
jgi:serine/threonine protein kinase